MTIRFASPAVSDDFMPAAGQVVVIDPIDGQLGRVENAGAYFLLGNAGADHAIDSRIVDGNRRGLRNTLGRKAIIGLVRDRARAIVINDVDIETGKAEHGPGVRADAFDPAKQARRRDRLAEVAEQGRVN